MTPTENAQIAYAILDEANGSLANGVPTEFVALDIAKAQVYATLATVPTRPSQGAIETALRGALDAGYGTIHPDDMARAVEAVEALL